MAIVLYASEIPADDAVPLVIKGWRSGTDKTIYVRGELMENEWPGPAATKANAKKRDKEVVLNAIPNSVVVVPKIAPENGQ